MYLDFVSAIAADVAVAVALLVYLRTHKGASVRFVMTPVDTLGDVADSIV